MRRLWAFNPERSRDLLAKASSRAAAGSPPPLWSSLRGPEREHKDLHLVLHDTVDDPVAISEHERTADLGVRTVGFGRKRPWLLFDERDEPIDRRVETLACPRSLALQVICGLEELARGVPRPAQPHDAER